MSKFADDPGVKILSMPPVLMGAWKLGELARAGQLVAPLGFVTRARRFARLCRSIPLRTVPLPPRRLLAQAEAILKAAEVIWPEPRPGRPVASAPPGGP